VTYASYVAIGDSFTEGLNDLDPATGTYRGWADRVAEHLAGVKSTAVFGGAAKE
jgi:hypothetical protein